MRNLHTLKVINERSISLNMNLQVFKNIFLVDNRVVIIIHVLIIHVF